jgi:soluble lytic murein transglycosylase
MDPASSPIAPGLVPVKPSVMKSTVAGVAILMAFVPSRAVSPMQAPPPGVAVRDSALATAREAIAEGRPWRATRVLAPMLRDSALRTPEVELVAATAAAGWHGWRETDELLRNAPWLDSAFDGEGRELLARAALGLGRDSAAVVQSRAAVRLAANPVSRGQRLVLLAKALEGIGSYDSASAGYRSAADLLPLVRDWLALRAVATSTDRTSRAALAGSITDTVVRNRLPLAYALAYARAGDTTAAIDAYTAAGSALPAFRLRVAQADSAQRRALGAELVAFISERSGSGPARGAVLLLDSLALPLSASQQLTIARSTARSGPLGRASNAYAAVFAAGAGTSQDRYAWAEVLFRLGRYKEAIAQYRKVTQPKSLAAAAGYRIARSMVRDGRAAEGVTQLRLVAKRWPTDSSAAQALFLMADLSIDDNDDRAARSTLLQLARQHPGSRQAAGASFQAAIIAYAGSMYEVAAKELDALDQRRPANPEALASLYWAGRSYAGMGDTATAGVRWNEVIARDSMSYYADAAARRLGRPPWSPAASPDTFALVPDLDSLARRANFLDLVMLDDEAALERARLGRAASSSSERLLAAADLMRRHGMPSQGISLARRAQNAGAPRDERLYRLLYPLGFPAALRGEAMRASVEAPLVAALTRQESLFDPEATSSAGARGLMQVMPEVGKRVAKGLGYPEWDAVLLYQADANLEIGSVHLKALLETQGSVVEVLAAYNAGAHRVVRWRTREGTEDPELLTERIPYVETRDYVRIVQRNRSLYRVLYDWPQQVTAIP